MFYVFHELTTNTKRQVVCVAFFLVESEAREMVRANEDYYYADKWSCAHAEQQAAMRKGWWK